VDALKVEAAILDYQRQVRGPSVRVHHHRFGVVVREWDVDDLDGLHPRGVGLFGGALVALAAHLVAVPAVVADKLEALVRDVLRDGGDEVAGGEDLEVAPDFGVEAGTVDNRSVRVAPVRGADLHLLDGEWIADDVLGQALQVLALAGQHAAAAVDVEAGMDPAAEHVRPCHRQQPLVRQKRDDPRPEQLLQRLEARLRQHVEQARAHKQTVRDQRVQTGVKIEVLAEGVDGHDEAGQSVGQAERGAQVFEQALVGEVA
jgi:hypothetical protein